MVNLEVKPLADILEEQNSIPITDPTKGVREEMDAEEQKRQELFFNINKKQIRKEQEDLNKDLYFLLREFLLFRLNQVDKNGPDILMKLGEVRNKWRKVIAKKRKFVKTSMQYFDDNIKMNLEAVEKVESDIETGKVSTKESNITENSSLNESRASNEPNLSDR